MCPNSPCFAPLVAGRNAALIDQFQRPDGMGDEELGSATIIGQCGDCGNNLTVAHEIPKAGFHSVDGDQHTAGDTVLTFQRGVELRVARLAFAPLRHDGIGAADPHEFVQRVFEAFLIAICGNGARGVLGLCQCLQAFLFHTGALGLLSRNLFPGLETATGVAARGGVASVGSDRAKIKANRNISEIRFIERLRD